MGGCVVSVMSSMNKGEVSPHPTILEFKDYGLQTQEIGEAFDNAARVRIIAKTTEEQHKQRTSDFYNGHLVTTLEKCCVDRANENAMTYRNIERMEKTTIKDEKGNEKPWELIHLSEVQHITYADLWKRIIAFGNGLRAIGLEAGQSIALYEDTRPEWMITCYAAWTQSMSAVTVYANLGEDALEYALKEAEVPLIVCNGKNVKNLVKILKRIGSKAQIVYLDQLPAGLDIEDVTVFSWQDVAAKGEGKTETQYPASPDDVALIMYTSGTTGDPKGVILAHGTVRAATNVLSGRLIELLGDPQPDETYVCYLPLAHILEFSCENIFLLRGTRLCFGNARTLTDTAARPQGDLKTYKPMFFVGVPRIFDTIKKVVESKLPQGTKRQVFDNAFAERSALLKEGKDTPFYNRKVFAAPRELFGGNVRAMISGGAPLSAKTQEFMHVVFGCPVLQGWGLTESASCGTTQRLGDLTHECIGQLLQTVEVKLLDVEDWKHTNEQPQGEILLRGPFLSKGYYKQPEMTDAAFKNGWFHTGDVGQWLPNGGLKIIGRVKALAKNVFGEYVAMEALEAVYNSNDLAVANGVCVLVDSQKAYIAALVLTDEAKAMAFAKKNGIEGTWPAVLENPEFHVKAAASLAASGKAAGKKPFELVKYVRVLNEEWTPENGVLTAASKLKRRVVDVKYADLIKELFKTE